MLRRLHALRVDFKACFWITIYEPAALATTIRPTRAVAVPLASFHFSRKARSNPAATHANAIGQSGKEVAVVRKPRGVSQSTGHAQAQRSFPPRSAPYKRNGDHNTINETATQKTPRPRSVDFRSKVFYLHFQRERAHPVRGKGRAHLQFDNSTNLLSSLMRADSRRNAKGASYA